MSGTELEVPETLHIETEDEAPPQNRELSPREKMMQDIAARSAARHAADNEIAAQLHRDAESEGLTYREDAPEAAAEPVVREAAPAPVTTAPEPAQVAGAPAGVSDLHTIDIDGQQLQVSTEQLRHLARVGVVTNHALHNYQQQQYQPPAPTQAAPAPIEFDDDAVNAAVHQIQFGDQAAAATALKKLMSDTASRIPAPAQQQRSMTPQEVIALVEHRQRAANEAATIQQEFAPIFENSVLRDAAALQVAQIRQANVALGRNQSDLDIYREAGNRVLSAFNVSRPGSSAETSPAIQAAPSIERGSAVMASKRAAPRATQTVDRRAPAPQAARGLSSAEIIDAMRKQRGQPSMM